MATIERLVQQVGSARKYYVHKIVGLTETEGRWKPDSSSWNAVEITEHLFWAEQGAICGMWKTLHAHREASMIQTSESENRGQSIEEIIARTWKEKEIVPASAAPRMGGALIFWVESLNGLQNLLVAFSHDLKEEELRWPAHPHPISGPLDFQQRFEFLSFHIRRHTDQVSRLIAAMSC